VVGWVVPGADLRIGLVWRGGLGLDSEGGKWLSWKKNKQDAAGCALNEKKKNLRRGRRRCPSTLAKRGGGEKTPALSVNMVGG